MATENVSRLTDRIFKAKNSKIVKVGDLYMTEETAKVDAQMKKTLQEERKQRHRQMTEEKERQSKLPEWHQDKKEPFDAYRVTKSLYSYYTEEEIQQSLQNKEKTEDLEMDYYLGFYNHQFTTNMEYVNFINSAD